MPQLIFFRQTDELATPLSVEEQSDAWWAGVQRCFAAVPIAVAAAVALSASLALGAQQQTDDIVPQPQAALDDGYYQVVVPPSAPPKILYLPDPEQIPAGSLRGTAEEDYWWSPPVRLVVSYPQPWAIEDDFSPTIDDPYWWMVVLSPALPLPPLRISDDDLPVTAAAAALDDGGWLPTVVLSAPTALPLLPLDDQAVPAAPVAAPPEEDLWQVTTPGPVPPQFLYLPDPEAIPGVLLGTVDDEPWAQPWIAKPSTPGQLWTLADELPIVAAIAEEDVWSPTWVLRPDSPRQPWLANEELPITAALDSDGWSAPIVSVRATVLTPWSDEDVKLTPPPPLGVDEVYDWRAYSIPAPVVASAWLVEIDGFQPPLFIPVDVVRLLQIVGHSAGLEAIKAFSAELIDPKGSA